MNIKQKFLLIYPIFIVATMLLLFPMLTEQLGKATGFVVSNLAYWLFCVIPAVVIFKGTRKLKEMYTLNFSKHKIYTFLAFLPAVVTAMVSFVPIIGKAGIVTVLTAVPIAIVNGTVEELFWRGTYNKAFGRFVFAFLYPTIMFTAWHVALTFSKGIEYKGGDFILLAGAAITGILYGLTCYKTKSLGIITLSHILTNFFGYCGMLYDNRLIR